MTEEIRNLAGPLAPSQSTAPDEYPGCLIGACVSAFWQAPLVEQCTTWSDAKDINKLIYIIDRHCCFASTLAAIPVSASNCFIQSIE